MWCLVLRIPVTEKSECEKSAEIKCWTLYVALLLSGSFYEMFIAIEANIEEKSIKTEKMIQPI